MSTAVMMKPIAEASPALKARTAGGFYMITVVMAPLGYFPGRGTHWGHIADLVAGAAYVVVTLLLYELLKPVSRNLSLLAAFFSLEGVAHSQDSLFFFGFYCVLLGYLMFNATFLPRIIGVLMVLAGFGLLINTLAVLLPPALAHSVSPFALGLDGVGEIPLALWLLLMGVNDQRWHEQASAAASARKNEYEHSWPKRSH